MTRVVETSISEAAEEKRRGIFVGIRALFLALPGIYIIYWVFSSLSAFINAPTSLAGSTSPNLLWPILVTAGIFCAAFAAWVMWSGKGWAVLAMFLGLSLLWLLIYLANPHSKLFTTPEGLMHVVLYYAAVGVAGLLEEKLPENRRRFGRLLSIAIFALLGISTAHMMGSGLPEFFFQLVERWNAPPRVVQPAVVTAPVCPGMQKSLTFTTDAFIDLEPGNCNPDLWHDGHCIFYVREKWTNDNTVHKSCGGPAPDVRWVKSADTTFVGAVALVPRRYRITP